MPFSDFSAEGKSGHSLPLANQETDLPTKENGGPGVQPLIINNPKGADTAHLSESAWDTLALCDKLHLYETDGFIALCTRGAGNAELVSALPDSIQEIYLWPQNDEAGLKWSEKVIPRLPKSAVTRIVRTPAEYPDLNDWIRAGATADDLLQTIKNADTVESAELADKHPAGEQSNLELWLPESLVVLSDESIDSSQTLLGNRWLEREQSLIVVGPSGVGKSVWAIQLSFLVAAGLSPFEIPNHAPRKILIIQAEHNKNDRIEMARMLHALQLSAEQKAVVHQNAQIVSVNNLCEQSFLRHLDGNLHAFKDQGFCPDIVVINPLTSYLGGDETKPDVCNRFLRTGLNPILCRYRCATIILHHGMGQHKARQFVNILIAQKKVFVHKIPREGAKSAIGYAKTAPQGSGEEEY